MSQRKKELEEDNQLTIFDILLIKEKDKLEMTLYRKETSTNRYMLWTSAQAPQEKINTIRALKNQAFNYCNNPQLLADELTKLQHIFHQNGYPPQLVHRILFSDSDPPRKKK